MDVITKQDLELLRLIKSCVPFQVRPQVRGGDPMFLRLSPLSGRDALNPETMETLRQTLDKIGDILFMTDDDDL